MIALNMYFELKAVITERRNWFVQHIQIENKKRQLTTLFTAYIVVRFLNLQHKIQITDTSGIGFKTDNLLKTIGKLIF